MPLGICHMASVNVLSQGCALSSRLPGCCSALGTDSLILTGAVNTSLASSRVSGPEQGHRMPRLMLVSVLWLPPSPASVSHDLLETMAPFLGLCKRNQIQRPNRFSSAKLLLQALEEQGHGEHVVHEREAPKSSGRRARCFSSSPEFSPGELHLGKKTIAVSTAPPMTSRNAGGGWVPGLRGDTSPPAAAKPSSTLQDAAQSLRF